MACWYCGKRFLKLRLWVRENDGQYPCCSSWMVEILAQDMPREEAVQAVVVDPPEVPAYRVNAHLVLLIKNDDC